MLDTLNSEQIKLLRGMVKEAVDSKTREAAEKDLRKDIAERAKDELEMTKKQFNQLVTVVYKQNLEKITDDIAHIVDLYEIIK